MRILPLLLLLLVLPFPTPSRADEKAPSRADVSRALSRAVTFFHKQVGRIQGTDPSHPLAGYVWKVSSDLQWRQGEGVASPTMIWVQPPGTPAVGQAFLDAYYATGDEQHLEAARDVARALVEGQLRSGGWYYHIEFDPEKGKKFRYRNGAPIPEPRPLGKGYVGGWEVWKTRRDKGNITLMDDDVTPSALRLLMNVDRALGFKDREIHDAIHYGLASVLRAQHPIGAWSHNYDRFPRHTPDPDYYASKKATYPESWSRTWTKDFMGCYSINDRITLNGIKTFLLAHEVYGEARYLQAAQRGGQFLLLAQMPEPQPAWAQQYDRHMHPVWDRKFEPPAITGLESQDALETLLLLYRKTANRKYLEPIPRALAYLQKSVLPNGRLARFYELKTNRPLYFNRRYELTYNPKDSPSHYGFQFDSRLPAIAKEYRELLSRPADPKTLGARPKEKRTPELTRAVQKILAAMDERGAWTEPGTVRNLAGRKQTPKDGILVSATFIDHVATLCRYLRATR
jgi:PelA/Pel-15E family pectate lyase